MIREEAAQRLIYFSSEATQNASMMTSDKVKAGMEKKKTFPWLLRLQEGSVYHCRHCCLDINIHNPGLFTSQTHSNIAIMQ